MNKKIFISYARKDAKIVNRITSEIASYGYQVWLDTKDITGGEAWRKNINTAIENCNIFLLFLSKRSVKSANVKYELNLAIEKKKGIIPVLLEEVSIPNDMQFPIVEIQWVKLSNDFHDTIKRLFVALGNNTGSIGSNLSKVKSISILNGNQNREDLVRAVDRIIDLVSSSQYTSAVSEGAKIREALARITDQNNLDSVLLRGGFEVWYAHALMYTGNTENATQLLNGLVENLEKWFSSNTTIESNPRFLGILGRAHNHLGYINWMNLGHYEMALSEFRKAARILLMGGKSLKRELATAYDNMGRVYAQLGFRSRALLLIEHGKQLREQSNDLDRLGLSLTSNAIANLEFGQPYRALQSSEKAYLSFIQKSSEIGQRGIGLALLTKAQSLRNISLQAFEFHQIALAMNQIEMALKILKRAEKAFLRVGEEVRLFQVYNELGCAHRERALLLKQTGATDKAFGAIDLAIQFLEESINIAKGNHQGYKYPAYYVDACEDIAQVYFINGNTKKTSEWLERGESSIPHNYKFSNSTPPANITAQECYEEFWQQLGKIYLLRGQMVSDTLSSMKSKKKNLSLTLQKSIQDFIIATAYFGRFSERPLNINNASLYPHYKPELRQQMKLAYSIYRILAALEADEIQKLKQHIYPRLCKSYHFKPVWLELFDDGLDSLLTISKEYS